MFFARKKLREAPLGASHKEVTSLVHTYQPEGSLT